MKRSSLLRPVAAAIVLGILLAAGPAPAQAPYQDQAPTVVLNQVELPLFGPAGFQRIDGFDINADTLLMALAPESCRKLAIFAEPEAWKSFFAEFYGDAPQNLKSYASIVTPIKPIDLKQLVPEGPTPAQPGGLMRSGATVTTLEIMDRGLTYLTFKSELGLIQNEDNQSAFFKDRTLVITSAVAVDDQVLLLNLYSNDPNADRGQLEILAAAWRDAYLKKIAVSPRTVPPVTGP